MQANTLNPTPEPRRNVGIDIARGIAMLLVIYEHAIEMYFRGTGPQPAVVFDQWQFISSFRMPLFFVISGFLYRPRSHEKALQNALMLLFTAYITHTLCWGLDAVAGPNKPWIGGLVLPFFTLNDFYSVTVWFLAALALIQLSFHCLLVLGGWRRNLFACAIGAGFLLDQVQNTNLFQLSALLPGILFYGFGHWLSRSHHAHPRTTQALGLAIVGFIVTASLAPLNSGCLTELMGNCPNKEGDFGVLILAGEYGQPVLFLVTAWIGSMAVIWFSAFLADRGGLCARSLSWVGRRTLDLLLLNGFVIWFIQPWLRQHVMGDSQFQATAVSALVVLAHVALLPAAQPLTRGIAAIAGWAAKTLCAVGRRPLQLSKTEME